MHSVTQHAMSPFRRRSASLMLVLAIVALGCRTATPRNVDDGPKVTTVDVQNQGFNDMTVYVVNAGSRTRLGIAPGNRTTTLTIPAWLVSSTTYLRFVLDPIGGNRTPVTEEIDVSPGDQLVLIVNPGG